MSLVLVTCPSTLSEEKKKNHADRTGLADNQVQGHGLAGRPGEAGGISRGTFESLLFFTWDTVKEREGARARRIDERADAPMVVASKSEREREREREAKKLRPPSIPISTPSTLLSRRLDSDARCASIDFSYRFMSFSKEIRKKEKLLCVRYARWSPRLRDDAGFRTVRENRPLWRRRRRRVPHPTSLFSSSSSPPQKTKQKTGQARRKRAPHGSLQGREGQRATYLERLSDAVSFAFSILFWRERREREKREGGGTGEGGGAARQRAGQGGTSKGRVAVLFPSSLFSVTRRAFSLSSSSSSSSSSPRQNPKHRPSKSSSLHSLSRLLGAIIKKTQQDSCRGLPGGHQGRAPRPRPRPPRRDAPRLGRGQRRARRIVRV